MTSVALNSLLTYIESLNLSKRNRKWLASKIIEPTQKFADETEYISSSPAMLRIIEDGRKEIAQGCTETINVDELWK